MCADKKKVTKEERHEKAKQLTERLQDKYGENSCFVASQENIEDKLQVEWISTGLLDIDLATQPYESGGGIPKGRFTLLYGSPGSGKTSLALSTIKEAQKDGLKVAYMDPESAFPLGYAKECFDIDVGDMIFSQDQEGETVIDIMQALSEDEAVDLIVVDSIAALTSSDVIKASMHDDFMAPEARMWAQAMRKIKGVLSRNNTALLMINQIREEVGKKFGNPETTPGGRAIKFFADLKMEVKKRDRYREGKGDDRVTIGHKIRVRIKKNKVGTSGNRGFADLYYNRGFDYREDLLNSGVREGIIHKSGGWLTYKPIGSGDNKELHIKENGFSNFLNAMSEKEKADVLYNELRSRILGKDEEEFDLYLKEIGVLDDTEENEEANTEDEEAA